MYGRRRIGKSALLRNVLSEQPRLIYFLADRTSEAQQRWLLAKQIAEVVSDFNKALYPNWETLMRALNRQLPQRLTLCLDEFPYLVKSCEALPSVIQKLLNEKELRFDLIICGSSQQLMQGYVLDCCEPLYGLADEIMRILPIAPHYIASALRCNAQQAVNEYAVWGGVPRYWELRLDYPNLFSAISALMLDFNGILAKEPQRLLRNDMRNSVQTETLLSIVGSGANKMSEIAAHADKSASQLTDAFSRLCELGYITRQIPFGEDEKKSKHGVYRISDPLFRFLYRFVVPHRSVLQLGRAEAIMSIIKTSFQQYVAECWEILCRDYVGGNQIDGVVYNAAGRWWGKVFAEGKKEGEMAEFDVVAESIDKKHILVGECKWTSAEDPARLLARLSRFGNHLPFVRKDQEVHFVLFLKENPTNTTNFEGCRVFLPEDVLEV